MFKGTPEIIEERREEIISACERLYQKMNFKEQLAEVIAGSLEKREQMLKMLCNNNHEIEANSDVELMRSFRKGLGKTVQIFEEIIKKSCPEMSHEEIMGIVYVFFPFMVGIYPYIMITDKHRKAAEEAGADICKETIHEFTYNCLIRLLNN